MGVYNKSGQLIGDISQPNGAAGSGRLALARPYWILHLDCGRKYFSVQNIKRMIDAMQTNGLNQLQLHFSDDRGFRFALDSTTIIDMEGNSYDLSSCISTTRGGALTEANMDEIIVYARSKNIDVVPSLDMPGHMGAILDAFPQFRYKPTSNWMLDVTNPTAVKFALALVEKYANYFQSRGCTYWNIGADEAGTDGTSANYGRWKYMDEDDIPTCVNFVNTIARYITSIGMIPRAFNDGVLYDGHYSNLFDKNIEIYQWARPSTMGETGRMQNVNVLENNGYRQINTSMGWYFIVPNTNDRTSNPAVENANLLKNFYSGSTVKDQDGACICIWCDRDTADDGGDAAMPSILADIASFGIGIGLTLAQLSYPIIR